MSLLTILAIVAAVFALPAVYNLIRRSDLRRMGIRNIVRRPVESILIIVGSALGTAIIVAALMVGDTFDNSIRDIARTDLGEVDATLEFDTPQEADEAAQLIASSNLLGLDGVLSMRNVRVAAAGSGTGDDRMVEPSISVAALDFSAAEQFGGTPSSYGFRPIDGGATTQAGNGEIVINDRLADDLGVGGGDPVSLFFDGNELAFSVTNVVERTGLGGYAHAFIDRSLIDQLDPDGAFSYDHVVVSATGEVFDSVDATRRLIENEIEPLLTGADVVFEPDPIKEDLLVDAEEEGAELTQIFSVVGGFSVLAGVLLLVNLFVMLAEERKPNLGVLRAIGWKRSSLRKAFRAEGVIYATIAAFVGALLGIGVGWVIVQLTKGILAGANPDSDFQLQFAVEPSSLVTAGLIGLIIAMAAVWFTSWRISRLNIISAIRDLPEPKTRRSRLLVMGAGALLIVGGGLMLSAGLSSDNAFLTIASVPIAATGAAIIAKSFVSPLVVSGVAGLLSVIWGAAFFPLMPAAMTQDVDIEFFLLFGVVVVAGGVALTTVLGPTIQKLVTRGNRPMVEARVAMAYPSARLFRTAASLAMYGLIIFTLAFMAVLSNSFSLQTTDIAASTAAGHDVMVQSNRTNPIVVEELAGLDGVQAVSPLVRNSALFSASWDPQEPDEWGFVGIEPDFATIGSPMLRDRDPRFATDQEALAAVAADPSLILVPTWFLGDEDGIDPPIGGTVIAETATTGPHTFEIVGVTNNDFAWSGPWMSASAALELRPDAAANRLYVAAEPGVDTTALASTIEARFLPNGAEAETFTGRVQRFVEADEGFFSLLRGYLLLGLVIGIAGLAVSLFRAVRERRRQIGMMRAMGLLGSGVRRWFMTEATFISVMGIATGVGLGMLTGYLSVTRSTAFDEELPFGVPWGVILFITIVPFVASAFAAIVPARRAARLRPSEALRLAD